MIVFVLYVYLGANVIDTTQKFVDSMNNVAVQNRQHQVTIEAPFSQMSKADEIHVAINLGQFDLLKHTMTCYNPRGDVSCGKCPSCAERIMNFIKAGHRDPIEYVDDFNWDYAVSKYEIS